MKDFGKNIKETTLASYFTKVTARPGFTRLRVIKVKGSITPELQNPVTHCDVTNRVTNSNILFSFSIFRVNFGVSNFKFLKKIKFPSY